MHRNSRMLALCLFFHLAHPIFIGCLHSAYATFGTGAFAFLLHLFFSFFFISSFLFFLSRHFWRMTLLRFMFFYMHLFYQSNIIHKLTMGRILDYKIFGWATTATRCNPHRHHRGQCNSRQGRHRRRTHRRWSRHPNPECRNSNTNRTNRSRKSLKHQ